MKTTARCRILRMRDPDLPTAALLITSLATAISVRGQSSEQSPASPPADIKPRNRNVSVSGDYLTGFGNITLPVGFSLDGVTGRSVQAPERDSTYYGGSISWQAFPSVGFDISYSQGTSKGTFDFAPDARWRDESFSSNFKLEDTWLQGYVRYRINRLSGTRFNGYFRGGVTYVDAEYTGIVETPPDVAGIYKNTGTSKDYTGNLGFGIDYRLFNIKQIRVRSVFEGEGFAGIRSRAFSEETFSLATSAKGTDGSNAMDNLIYGALGRLLLRMDYNFGKDSEWRLFLEGGVQARWTMETYGKLDRELNDEGNPPVREINESGKSDILWGPYVRAGIRYSF